MTVNLAVRQLIALAQMVEHRPFKRERLSADSRGFNPRMRYQLHLQFFHERVRVVKETGLRSVGSHLVGSTPTARISLPSSSG